MIVVVNNSEFEAHPENAAVIRCTNDMMNGFFVDYPDTYAFIPAETDGYELIFDHAVDEGIPVYDIEAYNPDMEPFKWIVNCLARLTVQAAQELLEEA
jgi:hypothetical protein